MKLYEINEDMCNKVAIALHSEQYKGKEITPELIISIAEDINKIEKEVENVIYKESTKNVRDFTGLYPK